MSFSPSSFFAGVGTVFVAIAVGFGGGAMMTATTQKKTDGPNRLERIASTSEAAPPAAMGPESATAPLVTASASLAESTPRRVDQPSAPASVSIDTSGSQRPQAAPTASAPASSEAIHEAQASPASVQVSGSVKSVERSRRAERRTNEPRKWTERKRPRQEFVDIAVARREPIVMREVAEEERTPPFGFFGQD
ncbi:MAG: hypothetical protein JWR89_5197 [Tardiphaga sp.]|uniref:hypothetical protein n=1 Tax=Tardiphaga sp. TaxID=1926292 RepID=UPI002636AB00|nr:hypothetical protein [Tardiphaga sp.]MDB5505295.1 hypothetical protein [Tardiphaga sp.]